MHQNPLALLEPAHLIWLIGPYNQCSLQNLVNTDYMCIQVPLPHIKEALFELAAVPVLAAAEPADSWA